jgi:hypothetical protein
MDFFESSQILIFNFVPSHSAKPDLDWIEAPRGPRPPDKGGLLRESGSPWNSVKHKAHGLLPRLIAGDVSGTLDPH